MHIQNLVTFCQLILTLLRRNEIQSEILTSVTGHNPLTNRKNDVQQSKPRYCQYL